MSRRRGGQKSIEKTAQAMRVRALSKLPCARATTVLGLEHFRATADGGVLALSFVTALLARPWKVGVPCQDHLRECSRRAVYRHASKYQIVGKSRHFFGGGCRATA